jgi:hypothetical protein
VTANNASHHHRCDVDSTAADSRSPTLECVVGSPVGDGDRLAQVERQHQPTGELAGGADNQPVIARALVAEAIDWGQHRQQRFAAIPIQRAE